MICALTARRIASGRTDEFIDIFKQGAEKMPESAREMLKGVYACRDVNDPDVILTFGLFDGTLEDMRSLQNDDVRQQQLDAIAPLVEETLLDSTFEVLHTITGAKSPAAH